MGYFNIELRPTFTAANCVTAFADGDLLFDWQLVEVPVRTPFRVLGVTAIHRGTNGANQRSQIELYFASVDSDGTIPPSLGTVNATIDGVGYFRHLQSMYTVQPGASDLDFLNIDSQDNTDGNSQDIIVISPDRIIGPKGDIQRDGVSVTGKIAIAGGSAGTPDFGTGVLLNQAGNQAITTAPTTLTVDGTVANKALAVGDTIAAADGAAIGKITSIAANGLSLEVESVTAALEDDDELVNLNPLTLIIHCEA